MRRNATISFLSLLLPAAQLGSAQPPSPASLAAAALARGDSAGAIAIAQGALAHGENAQLHDLLGRAYEAAGDANAASREFRAAVKLQPDVEQLRFDLGQFLLRSQDFQAARIALEDAHRLLPKSAQIELALAVADYCCVRYDDAVRAFLRTMELAPDAPQPYVSLGKILEHASTHLPEIAKRCALSEQVNPSTAEAPLLHAKVLIAEHRDGRIEGQSLDTAAHLLEKTLALNPNSADAYFTLGCLRMDDGDLPRAAELLEKSIQLNPTYPAARYRLGLVYARSGNRTRADQEFAAQAALKQTEHHGSSPVE